MEEEQTINLEDEEQVAEAPKVEAKVPRPENRFKDLSEKVEMTAKERDEARLAAEAAQKEVEFYKGFSKLKYPDAAEFQDKIKEKVMAGYDMEDAAISVLAKAGKLQSSSPVQRESPAGGSATTALKSFDDKPPGEMTTAEKRERLMQIERENPGSLSQTLRSINL